MHIVASHVLFEVCLHRYGSSVVVLVHNGGAHNGVNIVEDLEILTT